MRPDSVTSRHRPARSALVASLVLTAAACAGGAGGDTAPGTTGPPATAAPTLDPAVRTHRVSWVANLPTGLTIITRPLTRSDAPTHPIRLADGEHKAEALSYSPDGRALLFASDLAGNWDVWSLTEGSEAPTNLTADPGADGLPRWSPDGSRIAFFSDRGGTFDVWVMGADGSSPRQLSHGSKPVSWIAWSPDGRTILYSPQEGRRSWIERVAADGSSPPEVLADDGGAQWAAEYSPDGRTVAYSSQVGGATTSRIFVMRADGSGRHQLSRDEGTADREPHFSPDGTKMLFLRRVETPDGDNDDVIVHDLATGEERDVSLSQASSARQPSWSPDSKFVMFTTNRLRDDELAVVDAGGTAGILASSDPNAPDTWGAWDPHPATAS